MESSLALFVISVVLKTTRHSQCVRVVNACVVNMFMVAYCITFAHVPQSVEPWLTILAAPLIASTKLFTYIYKFVRDAYYAKHIPTLAKVGARTIGIYYYSWYSDDDYCK